MPNNVNMFLGVKMLLSRLKLNSLLFDFIIFVKFSIDENVVSLTNEFKG